MDRGAVERVLNEETALGSLPFSVEGLDVMFTDDGRVIAWVDRLDLEDLPTQAVTLLQSGKASVKALPKGRVLELHREAIASAALRVGIEFLQVLPLEQVEIVQPARARRHTFARCPTPRSTAETGATTSST